MFKIRRSCDRLIFNKGIPIPGKDSLYIEMGPREFPWSSGSMLDCRLPGRVIQTCLIPCACVRSLFHPSIHLRVLPNPHWPKGGLQFSISFQPNQSITQPTNQSISQSTNLSPPQVQFQIKSNGQFGPANDCVGFFTIPIWSGLVVTFVLLMVLTFGITMISQINTMDRFDDPKGKTITVNVAE